MTPLPSIRSLIGHGIDLIDVTAFGALISLATDAQSLGRYFTPSELADSGSGAEQMQKLAGRFATKEAVLKALGVGWGDGLSFTDIEIVVDALGAPQILLHGRANSLAAERGIDKWLVSTAHTTTSVVASVIALG